MYKHRILVVEDDFSVLEMFRVALNPDYEVMTAADGQIGYQHAQVGEPDLIILDLTLPFMNGVELCHSIKAIPQLRQIPIIVMTGDKSERTEEEVYKLGVDGMFYKPFKMEEMMVQIQSLLRLIPKTEKKMTLYEIQGYV